MNYNYRAINSSIRVFSMANSTPCQNITLRRRDVTLEGSVSRREHAKFVDCTSPVVPTSDRLVHPFVLPFVSFLSSFLSSSFSFSFFHFLPFFDLSSSPLSVFFYFHFLFHNFNFPFHLFYPTLWLKLWKKIQSAQIRAIPESVSEPFKIIPNQSELEFI